MTKFLSYVIIRPNTINSVTTLFLQKPSKSQNFVESKPSHLANWRNKVSLLKILLICFYLSAYLLKSDVPNELW